VVLGQAPAHGLAGEAAVLGEFILLDVHRSWRRVKVTDSRAAVDFAACVRELCDVHFPKAERIRVVLDNLSTHSAGALYQAFPAAEARRMLRRLEFHYTPKHAKMDGEYVARMENVLDLYAEPPDPKRPVVCFDESPVQLIGETRQPIPAMPGQLERYDCEYKRNGTENLGLSASAGGGAGRGCRAARATKAGMNTSGAGGFLRSQCLDRRIATKARLIAEVAAWERHRNASGARIQWMFTTYKARAKMGRAYPHPNES
jgi:hypothetical protein